MNKSVEGSKTINFDKKKLILSFLSVIFVVLMINTISAAEENVTDDTTIIEDNNDNAYLDISEKTTITKQVTQNNTNTEKNNVVKESAKMDPDIRLSGSEIHPGVSKTFLALFPSDATGNVVFKLDSCTISPKIKVDEGQVLYTYTIPKSLSKETYTLQLIYAGNSIYNSKKVNVTLTLTPEGGKTNAKMSMKNYTTKYLTQQTIKLNLNRNATGKVVFQIDNKNISKPIKIVNGVVQFNYTNKLVPGVHNLTAQYSGSYMYDPTNITVNFTVKQLKSSIKLDKVTGKAGNITLFRANVTDELKRPVANVAVKIKLNNMTIGLNRTDENGIALVYYKIPSSLYTQTNNITAVSSERTTVLAGTGSSTLKLKQLKTKVMVPNISTKPSKNIVMTATVVDEFNNYVTKGTVTFMKNNVTLATVKVENGFAKYTYPSNYETSDKVYLYATYTGDWKYASSSGRGTYKVTQLKTTITSTAIEAKPNDKVIFTATVRDQNQNHATEGQVRFSLNGKVIGTTLVSDGVAKLRYTLNSVDAGSYRLKTDYLGTKIYKSSTNNNTLTVNRYDISIQGSQINGVVGNQTTISLTITDEEKYYVKNGTVKFYIENEYIGSSKVSNGVVEIDFIIPSKYDGKTVKYYATYEKNGVYESSSYSNNVIVTHQKTVYVSPNGNDANLGDEKHPFKTLKYAVDHVTLFGTIRLAEGTYSASGIKLDNSISIIGSGRDKTYIDGENSGVPIFNISKRNVFITFDGVTIRNGKSNNQYSAGAITTSGRLNIINSRFINNVGNGDFSGGAIYTNGILNVTNTEFTNNMVTNANSQGGAIRTYNNTTYITNCKFDSNQVTGSNSTGGSAIYSASGDMIINKTTFTKNNAKGKYITGGVIRTIYGALVIDNCNFNNNYITSTDYAIGGVIGSLSSGVSIMNSAISSNTIEAINTGGGTVIYIESAALEIAKSQLNSNKVITNNAYGGAIYGYYAFIEIDENTVNNNNLTAKNNGFGGAIYTNGGNLTIGKTNFTSNTIRAKNMALAGVLYSNSNVTISNSNLMKNNINGSSLGGGAIANMGNLTIIHTNLIDNDAYSSGNAITTTPTAVNNINGNYWGSTSPTWTKLLNGLSKPSSFSTSKYAN